MKTAVHLHITTPQTNDYRKAGLQPAFREPVVSCRVHVWSNDFNASDLYSCLYDLKNKIILHYIVLLWHAVAQLVGALRYKQEGREFDSR